MEGQLFISLAPQVEELTVAVASPRSFCRVRWTLSDVNRANRDNCLRGRHNKSVAGVGPRTNAAV